VEVKGVLDATDEAKLGALVQPAASQGIMLILAESGRYRLCQPSPQMWQMGREVSECATVAGWSFSIEADLDNEVAFVRCAECGKWYFEESAMGWGCPACGHSDGNCTFDLVHPGSYNWTCHDCPDCGEKGMRAFIPGYQIRYEHQRARNRLNNAVKGGYVTRITACEVCGSEDGVEAHHQDYSKPLEVRWLCKDCHYSHHGGRRGDPK